MLRTPSGLIANPSRMTYLAHGWKFLDIQPPADPPEGKEYVISGYTETATDIQAVFKLVEIYKLLRKNASASPAMSSPSA